MIPSLGCAVWGGSEPLTVLGVLPYWSQETVEFQSALIEQQPDILSRAFTLILAAESKHPPYQAVYVAAPTLAEKRMWVLGIACMPVGPQLQPPRAEAQGNSEEEPPPPIRAKTTPVGLGI